MFISLDYSFTFELRSLLQQYFQEVLMCRRHHMLWDQFCSAIKKQEDPRIIGCRTAWSFNDLSFLVHSHCALLPVYDTVFPGAHTHTPGNVVPPHHPSPRRNIGTACHCAWRQSRHQEELLLHRVQCIQKLKADETFYIKRRSVVFHFVFLYRVSWVTLCLYVAELCRITPLEPR